MAKHGVSDGCASQPTVDRMEGVFPRGMILVLPLFAACVSDGTLLDENVAVAIRSVRMQARQDLSCPQLFVKVLSEKEVPGAPWGYLYSDYRIRAEGCRSGAVYEVECRDESLCEVKRASE